jgi:hypothetical protein
MSNLLTWACQALWHVQTAHLNSKEQIRCENGRWLHKKLKQVIAKLIATALN